MVLFIYPYSYGGSNIKNFFEDYKEKIIIITKVENLSDFVNAGIRAYGVENYDNNKNFYLKIVELVEGIEIDKILFISETDTERAAILRNILGVDNGQSISSAISFRNKYIMRSVTNNNRDGKLEVALSKNQEKVDSLCYPKVFKPLDSFLSQGVRIIEHSDDIINSDYKNNSIYEEFSDGELYHIDAIIEDDKVIYHSVSKYFGGGLSYYSGLPYGSYQLPSNDTITNLLFSELEKTISNIETDRLIIVHGEYFVNKNHDVTLCEIASRVGGGYIPESIIESSGFNIEEAYYRMQMGEKLSINSRENDNLAAWLFIPHYSDLTFKYFNDLNFEYISNKYYNDSYDRKKKDINPIINRVGGLIFTGNSTEDLLLKYEEIKNSLSCDNKKKKYVVLLESNDIGLEASVSAIRSMGMEPCLITKYDRKINCLTKVCTSYEENELLKLCPKETVLVTSTLDSKVVLSYRIMYMLNLIDFATYKRLDSAKSKYNVFKQIPLRSPKTELFNNISEAKNNFIEGSHVLKPDSMGGGIGVQFDLNTNLDAHPISNKWVLQEKISGEIISCEGYVIHNTVSILGFTRRVEFELTEVEFIFSRHIDDSSIEAKMEESVIELIRNLAIRDDFFHIEFIVDENKALVIDANIGRPGGGPISKLISDYYDRSLVDFYEFYFSIKLKNIRESIFEDKHKNKKTYGLAYGFKTTSFVDDMEVDANIDSYHKLVIS